MSPGRTIVVPLMAAELAQDENTSESVHCLRCGSALELHQPAIDEPDRLVGVCPVCASSAASWHLIDLRPEGGGPSIVLLLPDVTALLSVVTPSSTA